ncbi:receptor-like protein 50 [Argentina anserina]|uniref:receptor-like protein 50 n=1 Tax=Argentina anserina TaxID=57926 RepID=UPI0021765603|nr:receptor-like protein 50 [Potentilla anserina]
MESLDLYFCGLKGKLPSSLGMLKNLQHLGHNRSLTEAHFIDLTRLESFRVSSNGLEGEILEEISGLMALSTLNLLMNLLSGNIPSKIGNLSRLETLDLSQNHLTFLSHLNLFYNNLSGRIPSGSQLQSLDDPSIYEGNNPSFCGLPLSKCPGEDDDDDVPHAKDDVPHAEDDKDHVVM